MKQKSVGLTLRALILALVLSLVAGTPALPPLEGVAYAQDSGLTATLAPDNSSVSLSWDAVAGADSYEIWRGEVVNNVADWGTSAYATVEPVPPATEPPTTYTDSSVTAGTTYAYAVRSVTGGTAAAWTGPYPNVTIGSAVAAPTGTPVVTLTPDGNTAVNVSWTSVSGTGVLYQVQFWHSGLGNQWSRISGTQTSPYKHENLTPGVEYYYVVRAYNAGGEVISDWDADDSFITLQATTAVPALTLTPVDRTTVTLTWTHTTGAAQYDLQRRKLHVPSGDTAVTTGDWARLPSALLPATTISHTDNTAMYDPSDAESVTYQYRVQKVDSGGLRGDWSNVEEVAIPSTANRLLAPANTSASSPSHDSIRVEWDGVEETTYYEVQSHSGDGNWSASMRVEPLAVATSRHGYTHPNLSPATKYYYRVRAVNINGASDWSETSATTRSTPSATGQMPRVTGLRLTDESTVSTTDGTRSNMIKLTWNAVGDATHYDIQRFDPGATTPAWGAPEAGNDLVVVGTMGRIPEGDAGSPPSWTDEGAGLAAGGTYYYVVSAVDNRTTDATTEDDDMGEWSAYVMITLDDFRPLAPTNLVATATDDRSIWISWAAPDASGATDGAATSYTLEWRLTGANAAWNPMTVTGRTNYLHSGLRPNTRYHYRVKAHNSGGESGYATETDATTLPSQLRPPANVEAVDATEGGTAAITISWDEVTGATGYQIQRFGLNGNEWGDLAGAAGQTDVDGTETTDSGASTANTTYFYRVRSMNSNGNVTSTWSAVVRGTTQATAPAAPTLVATSTGVSMIRLSWGAVSGATAYKLEWLEGDHDATVFGNDLIPRMEETLPGTDRHFVHTNLKAGTQYSYRLQAQLPLGVVSAWQTTIVDGFTKPASPDLSATAAVSTTMTLTWDAVTFPNATTYLTADGNYQLERRESNSGDWTAVTLSTACETTGANANKCTASDTGLEPGKRYFYRIRAVTTTPAGITSYWDQTNQRTPSR